MTLEDTATTPSTIPPEAIRAVFKPLLTHLQQVGFKTDDFYAHLIRKNAEEQRKRSPLGKLRNRIWSKKEKPSVDTPEGPPVKEEHALVYRLDAAQKVTIALQTKPGQITPEQLEATLETLAATERYCHYKRNEIPFKKMMKSLRILKEVLTPHVDIMVPHSDDLEPEPRWALATTASRATQEEGVVR